MKRVINISFILILLLQAVRAQTQKVAMLEPLGTVSNMQKAIIRASLSEAITNSEGYEALSRMDIDQIMDEFHFQEGGMVSDEQRKELGRLSGAELLCITRLTDDGNDFFVECSLIEMESGKIVKTASELMASSPNIRIKEGCAELAAKLVGTAKKSSDKISNAELYNKGKEITFTCEPFSSNLYLVLGLSVPPNKVKVFLDEDMIWTGGLEGFVIKIKDPNPVERMLRIVIFRNEKQLDGGGTFKIDTSVSEHYKFTTNKMNYNVKLKK